MIFDSLERLGQYKQILHADEILSYLKSVDLEMIEEGEHEIKGRDLFVRVLRYYPKPARENYFETHRHYADVQCVFKGAEGMQLARKPDLEPIMEYDSDGDYQFFKADRGISNVIVDEREFIYFAPGEPHKPVCKIVERETPNLKLVFKVKMN